MDRTNLLFLLILMFITGGCGAELRSDGGNLDLEQYREWEGGSLGNENPIYQGEPLEAFKTLKITVEEVRGEAAFSNEDPTGAVMYGLVDVLIAGEVNEAVHFLSLGDEVVVYVSIDFSCTKSGVGVGEPFLLQTFSTPDASQGVITYGYQVAAGLTVPIPMTQMATCGGLTGNVIAVVADRNGYLLAWSRGVSMNFPLIGVAPIVTSL